MCVKRFGIRPKPGGGHHAGNAEASHRGVHWATCCSLLLLACSGGTNSVSGLQQLAGGAASSPPSAAISSGVGSVRDASSAGAQSVTAGATRMQAGAPAGSGRSGGSGGVTAAVSGGAGGAAGSATEPKAGSGAMGAAAGAGGMSPALREDQALIPHASWDCGMPEGIPATKGATLVFEATLDVAEVHDLGQTQYGKRLQIDIKGGMATGPKLKATFMGRGLDYQLTLDNGVIEDEQINIMRTGDGSYIYVRTCGAAPQPAGEVRVVMDFEAPSSGGYNFLNTGKFVGSRHFDAATKTLKLSVYEASGAVDKNSAVQIVEPSGVPDQHWECKKYAGTPGAVVYTESVGIGDGSIAVGASKRGTRNIIPITGGTTSGKIEGTVLSGGADYQLFASAFELDARYTLHTSDGELIIVRNCGPVGALVPVFEAPISGKHAWLNENKWLSSDPGVGAGVVNLTIYEGGQ